MINDGYNTYLGKAFRFISFEGLFNTIRSRTLRFTRAGKYNDPLDNSPLLAPIPWGVWPEKLHKLLQQKVFDDVCKSTYICCFSKEYNTRDGFINLFFEIP